jgi:ABC-type dipeptide/oligopeptide/nickel transport system ATPase component
MSLLRIRDLRVSYPGPDGPADVVHGIDLDVAAGSRAALVGESGSGKSVTARAVLGLDTDATVTGSIQLSGTELAGQPAKRLRAVRGSRVGLVFQDPLAALNPVMTIGWQIMQPLVIRGIKRREARRRGIDLLGRLGVRDADRRFDDYPHQFSGGMRQRVIIAIAIIAEPELLIADEPTTALDVRVQEQVLELLMGLADERDMAVLLITHDLSIVAGFAERVVVLRHGRVIEHGTTDDIFYRPAHPYTRGLLGAIPRIDADPAVRLATVPPDTEADAGEEPAETAVATTSLERP